MKVLLTGGAGYIGSHTAVELLKENNDVVILDNLSNSSIEVISNIEKITGKKPVFYNIDIKDEEKLEEIFNKEKPGAAMHFAGYKAVGESVSNPLMYYENNLVSSMSLLKVMKKTGCSILVFSSSATVYGTENKVPFYEDMKTGGCTNPYGWTKFMIEQIIMDETKVTEGMASIILRYFNPIGADESGLIGEKPQGIPNNLMPYIQQVASGIREKLYIYGDDYDTIDGTGVRDYIHVTDLALGHLRALEYAKEHEGCEVFNLGTGNGSSVLEVVNGFKKANGVDIPYVVAPRRDGDIASCYADCKKAKELLKWEAKRDITKMCKDAWTWEKNRKK